MPIVNIGIPLAEAIVALVNLRTATSSDILLIRKIGLLVIDLKAATPERLPKLTREAIVLLAPYIKTDRVWPLARVLDPKEENWVVSGLDEGDEAQPAFREAMRKLLALADALIAAG